MTYIPTITDLSDIRARAALGIGHLSVTDVVVLCAEVERLRMLNAAGWGAASANADDLSRELEKQLPGIVKELRAEVERLRDLLVASTDLLNIREEQLKDELAEVERLREELSTARAHLELYQSGKAVSGKAQE